MLKKSSKNSYEQYAIRRLAQEKTLELITELQRIALGRITFESNLEELAESIQDLLKLLKRRKIEADSVSEQLSDILRVITLPPSNSDIIKAIDTLLQRGWGRPSAETVDYSMFIDMDPTEAQKHVQASLIARALQGDVAAQQAYLRLPSQIEVLGLGDEDLDATRLNEEDMAIFMSLVEKMRTAPLPPAPPLSSTIKREAKR